MSETMEPSGPSWAVGGRGGFRPGRRGVIAVAAVALLLLGAAAWAAFSYFDSINHLSRGSVPGTVEVTATGGSRIVVYYEGHGTPTPADLDVRVTAPDGVPVQLTPFSYDLRYDVESRTGRAIGVFDATTSGTYRVSSTIAEPGARLAVGSDVGGVTLLFVFAVIAALIGLAAAALSAALAVAMRPRRRLGAAAVAS